MSLFTFRFQALGQNGVALGPGHEVVLQGDQVVVSCKRHSLQELFVRESRSFAKYGYLRVSKHSVRRRGRAPVPGRDTRQTL